MQHYVCERVTRLLEDSSEMRCKGVVIERHGLEGRELSERSR
jgi:hypothetical protein